MGGSGSVGEYSHASPISTLRAFHFSLLLCSLLQLVNMDGGIRTQAETDEMRRQYVRM